MIGIYKITNPIGETYFGQSWNLHKRILSYKRMDCKKQPKIYTSLIKYGVENHDIRILTSLPEISTQEQLDWWESYLIEQYKKYGIGLLNIRGGGISGYMAEETKERMRLLKSGIPRPEYLGENNPYYGKKHSDEVRDKMSKSNKGNKVGLRNGRAKSINQYSLTGEFIKKWDTINQAAIGLNISRQSINCAVVGRNKTAHGFIWEYTENNKTS